MKDTTERYSIINGHGEYEVMNSDVGDWVLYETHADIYQKMQDEIDRLQSRVEDLEAWSSNDTA